MPDSTKIVSLNDEEAMLESEERSFWGDTRDRLLNDPLTLLALFILILLTFACFAGPPLVENILHVDVEDASVRDRYLPPSSEHILGTDIK